MNKRHKQVLKELSLSPVWHLNPLSLRKHNDIQIKQSAKHSEQDQEIQQMSWEQLKLAASYCNACALSQTRTQSVFGIGDENADWLFIGEGPGAREDAIGEPFVGQAGKLLDQMLAAIQLKRGRNVYITNIVKCRPPNNRNPNSNETHQCKPFLSRQIELIQPKLIIALGKVAAQNLLDYEDSILNLRGKIHYFKEIPLIVTYHPAYLLRTLSDKSKAWKDLCFALSTMQTIK